MNFEPCTRHEGLTVVEFTETGNLLKAYQKVLKLMLENWPPYPATVAPHPDHPDRLRLTFANQGTWGFWVRRLDGSTDAAINEPTGGGEVEHRWTSPDGLLWLAYYSPDTPAGSLWEAHDDPEMNR